MANSNDTTNSNDESWRDLRVLEEIEQNPQTSQRGIASSVGIALGLTNSILKRLIHKGWVKTKTMPANRFAYYLTTEGFSKKSHLVLEYVKLTTSFFFKVRVRINDELSQLAREHEIKRVAIYGTGELAEAVYLSIHENRLQLSAIYDDKTKGKQWLGLTIQPFNLENGSVAELDADLLMVVDENLDLTTFEKSNSKNIIVLRIADILAANLRAFARTMDRD